MRVGTKIDLATHSLTKHLHREGHGVVTAITVVNALSNEHKVIVRVTSNKVAQEYLHLSTKNVKVAA